MRFFSFFLFLNLLWCSFSYSEELLSCVKCYTGTFFVDYAKKQFDGGVEINRWIHWFDKYSSIYEMEKKEDGFIKKWILYGGGLRFRTNQFLDEFYLSLYPMTSFQFFWGMAAGPEIGLKNGKFDYGIGTRLWFTLIGVDFIKTYHSAAKIHLYLYVPLYMPWIDAYG